MSVSCKNCKITDTVNYCSGCTFHYCTKHFQHQHFICKKCDQFLSDYEKSSTFNICERCNLQKELREKRDELLETVLTFLNHNKQLLKEAMNHPRCTEQRYVDEKTDLDDILQSLLSKTKDLKEEIKTEMEIFKEMEKVENGKV
jgi:hypothetical protein